jgi:hypothetical protein
MPAVILTSALAGRFRTRIFNLNQPIGPKERADDALVGTVRRMLDVLGFDLMSAVDAPTRLGLRDGKGVK